MLDLRSPDRPLRIGHRGAAALAPENTIAALRAAVEHGVDMVEFDVLSLPGGGLVLAHSTREAAELPAPFERGLVELAPHPVALHVDVKGAGFESAIVEALRRHRLVDRAVVSSVRSGVLRRFAALEPRLARALSYPEDRLGISRIPLTAPLVRGALVAARQTLPRRIEAMLERAQATAASLNHVLLTAATIERCHALGVPVLAWTVNDPARAAALAVLGVDGVVTDDPRIFAGTLPT